MHKFQISTIQIAKIILLVDKFGQVKFRLKIKDSPHKSHFIFENDVE